ncbi:MAG: antibiotic biosynthesis monooxygenase [Alphaproteobacteria bacterium]|nr:antibiotic biosynthesis monooxygenase [Alphaproteobacteria bacterium]
MIVVSGVIEVAEKDKDLAIEAATAMAAETRKEAGCRVYAFYQDIENPGAFRVFEEWDDEAALKAHFETPHMGAFRAALAEIGILSRDVKIYRVSGTDPL